VIFQHTHRQVLDGSKTQTRRLVKDGERYIPNTRAFGSYINYPALVERRNGHAKWTVGKTYAVQPGRTDKGIGTIRITAIRRERLRDITEEDAIAEGCAGEGQMDTPYYSGMLDQPMWEWHKFPSDEFAELWDSVHKPPNDWKGNPEVWVLEFELVKETADAIS